MTIENHTTKSVIPFRFFNYDVRIHLDELGNPWWEAQDVCLVLGIRDVSQAVSRLSVREKRTCETRNVLIINESGLYERAVATFQVQKLLRKTMPVRTAADRHALAEALKNTETAWWHEVALVFAKGYTQFCEEHRRLSHDNYARLRIMRHDVD